ncbi:putative crossover junction endonuclease EME2 [Erethizon dorsatum]
MTEVGPGRAAGSRRGRVQDQRRPPTWEISDSDLEGDATAEAGAGARSAAGERRAAPEARRPEKALQRLTVLVDPAVLEDAGSDILMEALSALGCECCIEPQSPARSLQWSGVRPDPQSPGLEPDMRFLEAGLGVAVGTAGVPVLALGTQAEVEQHHSVSLQVLPEVWAAEDQELLLLLEPEEFLQGVTQLTQVLSFLCILVVGVPSQNLGCSQGRFSSASLTLERHRAYILETLLFFCKLAVAWWPVTLLPQTSRQWCEQVCCTFLPQTSGPPCSMPWISTESPAHPHVAVIGLDAYLWSHQPIVQGTQPPESPEVAQAQLTIGWPEVEEALVLLQLLRDLDVLLVASWQELSQHVCSFTKALAQRPSKRYRDSQAFSFCTAGRWASGQRVARDGSGLRGVWWRQIQQFNRVSPAVADAVVAAFPSPHLLQQALLACSTEQERLGLLADLPVKAHRSRQRRRVGPDLSRRICLFLTTTNPDLLLDLGS